MANRYSILWKLSLLVAFCAAPVFAQVGAIEGDVKNADGSPAIGAQIVIDRTDMKGHYDVKVKDKKTGHYYYGGLPLGTYKVSVVIDGKPMDSVSGVRVGLGEPIKVDFDLKQAQLRAQAAQAGMVIPEAQAGQAQPKISKEEQAKIEEVNKKNEEIKKKNAALTGGFNAGLAAMQAKDYAEAIKQFQTAAEVDPNQSAVWANMGEAYNQLSKTKSGDERKEALSKGTEAYQKAVDLKADDGSLHHNLGLMYVNSGQVDKGVIELKKAAELQPANAGQYYYNLGAVLINNNRTDEAVQAFQDAVKADPTKADAYFQIGTALMGKATTDTKTGKITPAPGTIEGFQKYLDLSPNGPNAETAKAMIAALGGTVITEIKSDTKKKKP